MQNRGANRLVRWHRGGAKKSGAVRICVDLTKLNESVCREKYILPSVEETLGMLAGARIFSKLDAKMGFWQIPLTPHSEKLTTFITPLGRYYFKRLPFGIASAPEHFQNRMATEVTEGLEGVVCHMDDVLIWGRTQEEHDARLHATLERIQEAGITLNVKKCELSKSQVTFLGHVISDRGIRPDPGKTEAVRMMPEPTNTTELRSFLGMLTQLGRFVPQLAERDKPLRDLLSKKNCWVWSVDQARAFQDLKDAPTSTPVLAMFDPNRESKVSADASSYGLGGVLLQKWEEEWRPIAYKSRSLTPTEQRYAQVEKEALMQLCTEGWPEHGPNEPALRLYRADHAFLTVHDGILLKGQRLVIPPTMRNDVLAKLHEGHQGVVKCRQRARQSVWWPGLSQQLNELVLNCRTCCKERRNRREPMIPSPYPGRPWEKLGADLFVLGGKTYLLVVDYMSRYVEIAPLASSKSDEVIRHLKSIYARHGIPDLLVSDGGPQFSGTGFRAFAESYEFRHITSSPRYPQGNAEAERAVQTVQGLLKKADDPYLALLAYRATPLENGYSAEETTHNGACPSCPARPSRP
ncbi:uncharacterized protein K02A2.6-like [Hippocampus zosterae]|uniref:uncharacterized protein K02A2.6-like n=1 Tax=Hippocampus zosterae TaxID=109293 RepID=UPI00223DA87C|nr:uncharacterized protein K02A2.6-like [Hippocampus zosterae]